MSLEFGWILISDSAFSLLDSVLTEIYEKNHPPQMWLEKGGMLK